MTPAEAAALLAVAAAFDNRKPDADAATAWAMALDDLPFTDCRNAVVAHYRKSAEWLMPSMVRETVRAVRSKRIAEHENELLPPPECREGRVLHEWLAQARRRLGDGEPIGTVNPALTDLEQRNLGDLRELIARPERPEPETPEPNPHVDALRAELSKEDASHG